MDSENRAQSTELGDPISEIRSPRIRVPSDRNQIVRFPSSRLAQSNDELASDLGDSENRKLGKSATRLLGLRKSDIGNRRTELRNQNSDLGSRSSDLGVLSSVLCFLFSVFLLTACSEPKTITHPDPADKERLLNQVLDLSQAGVGYKVIVAHVRQATSGLVLETSEITRLKQAGVHDLVIEALIRSNLLAD